MWKECLLLSIITINICGSSNSAQLAKSGRSKNVRGYEHPRYQQTTHQASYGVEYAEEEEYSTEGKLIGRWRNNGEALEPKWRDGDSIPLVPFYVATIQDHWQDELDSKGEQAATGLAIHDEYSTKQYSKHRPPPEKSNDQTLNRYDRMNLEKSISNVKQYPIIDKDYEDTHKNRYKDFQSYESRLSKESKYPRPVSKTGESFEDSDRYSRTNYSFQNYDNARDSGIGARQKKVEDVTKVIYEDNENLEGVVMKYRETFQNRPDEYELSEDEYEKPRPRKRRPPQNDEFAEPRNSYPAFKSDRNSSSETNPNSKSLQNEGGVNVRSHRKLNSSSRNTNNYHSVTSDNSEVHNKLSENARLKLLLKMQQDEDLSLSEILQQKNLTLMDLLKGNANIISVLKSNNKDSEDIEESSSIMSKSAEIIRTERPRWMPSRRSRTYSNETKVVEMSSGTRIGKVHFPQRFLLTKKKDNKNATNDSEKFPVADEPLTKFNLSSVPMTTENSITKMTTEDSTELFQNNASNVKHDVYYEKTLGSIDEDEILEFSDFAVTKPKTATTKVDTSSEISRIYTTTEFNNVHQDGVSTLSIEHILTSTEETVIENLSENVSMIDDKIDFLNETSSDDEVRNKNYRNLVDKSIEHGNHSSIFKTLELKYQGDDVQQNIQLNDKTVVDAVQNRLRADRNCSVNTEEIESTTIADEVTLLNRDETPLEDRQNLTSNYKLYKDTISEVEPVARAEIFELFNSSSSAKRLEQLLKSRNMSLDELIALRQRGSSQVHLAEVFRSREENLKYQKLNKDVNDTKSKWTNKTEMNIVQSESIETTHASIFNDDPRAFLNTDKNKLPTNKTEDVSDIANSTYDYLDEELEKLTSNLSDLFDYHRYIENVNTSSNDTKSNKDIDSIDSNDDDQMANSKTTMEENSETSTQVLDLMTAFDSLPFSKNIRQDSEGSSYYTSITEVKIPIHETYDSDLKQPTNYLGRTIYPASSPTNFIEEGLVEEIVKNDLNSISEMYGLKNDSNDKKTALSKVKPSIIASGAILGVTIVVFLAIFIACRIRQKQKFTYKNTFSKAVFQNSTMTARKLSNSSSLNTIMVNVIATSTTKRPQNHEIRETDDDDLESNSDIENDSLDANDSWETIPDFLK